MQLFSVRCTWGNNGPVERAEGEERWAAWRSRWRACQAVKGKAPWGSRESPRPASNSVNVRDSKETNRSQEISRSGNRRIDAVSIGRDPMSRTCLSAGVDVYRSFLGEREFTDRRANSRAARIVDERGVRAPYVLVRPS